MFVLDTNVVSELMKPEPDVRVQDWFRSAGDMPMATTVITVSEIVYGLQRLPSGRKRDGLYNRFGAFISALALLPLDDGAAVRTGQFRAMREAGGLPSTPSDMMIAGITAATNSVLITRNTRDFDTLPLESIDPWKAG